MTNEEPRLEKPDPLAQKGNSDLVCPDCGSKDIAHNQGDIKYRCNDCDREFYREEMKSIDKAQMPSGLNNKNSG